MRAESSSRRQFLQTLGMGASLTLFPGITSGTRQENRNQPPNVILILTDDQGYGDTGIHGNKQIHTPNIDRLARQGTDFTRFYVEPVCSPTRASLMTGRYYYRTGVIHTSRGGAKMAGEERTTAELLKDAGYATGIFGKWHLGDNYPMRPQDKGFDETLIHRGGGINQTPDKPNSYFNPLLWKNGERFQAEGYCTDVFFDGAMDFIRRNSHRPFFIYLPTNTPHTPLEVGDDYADPYRKMGYPDRTARVYGMIKNIDDNIARLLQHLKQLNLEEDTVIIFISDNGPNTDRYNAGLTSRKSSNYEGGIRAISFFRWLGHWKQGQKIDRIAAHIDIVPTILDICGVRVPPDLHLDGRSLKPLIEGDVPATEWADRTLFIQCHRSLSPQRYQNCAAISQRYKMVGYPDTFNEWTFHPSLSNPTLELYDIKQDPGETQNLAAQYPEILAKLRGEYDAWFNDVQHTRNFTPGIIHLGTKKEDPATLCRYQDSTYHLGIPHGWQVKIEQGGKYRLNIDRGRFTGPGRLVVKWQDEEKGIPLKSGQSTGIFELDGGEGRLEIWFELDGIGRITFSDNGTIGNVEMSQA